MLGHRSDLPLEKDATSRFLPWLVAPMVFLSAIALAAVFIFHSLIARWDRDVSGTLTVEIASAIGEPADSAEATRKNVEKAVALLTRTPGILAARALSREQLTALLTPWLGNGDLLKDLPLPALIDVTTRLDKPPDLDRLAMDLKAEVPEASLDDHRIWLSRLIGLSRSIQWLAVAVVILIGAVTSATVFYATRSGMAIHQELIEVMHLIGAPDDYIARQFSDRAFTLALKGGVLGLLLTVPMLLALGLTTHHLQGGFLTDLDLPLSGWASVLALPLTAALLAMATARIAVHRALAHLP